METKPNSFTAARLSRRHVCVPALVVAISIAALAVAGCRGKHNRNTVQNEEPAAAPRIVSTVKMNDPNAPAQLLHGFYGVEGGAWRWTADQFAVVLRTPLGAVQRGATLKFAFNVPDVVVQKLGAIKLTASIGSTLLKSEKYSTPGSYTFTADIPPDQLTKETITVDFALDKSLTPGMVENRNLGLIAMAVGIESK